MLQPVLRSASCVQTDSSGSLEAVRNALTTLPQSSVVLRYLLAVPNDITVSDVDLAAASKGLILGFNMEPSEVVQTAAKQKGVACIAVRPMHLLKLHATCV